VGTSKEADRLAEEKGVEDSVDFKVNDFTDTEFKDESFDVIWAIESVCYAAQKINFLKEAFRLLKEGGRIVVADGFLKREPQSEREKKILEDFCEGFALPGLEYFDKFEEELRKWASITLKLWRKMNKSCPLQGECTK